MMGFFDNKPKSHYLASVWCANCHYEGFRDYKSFFEIKVPVGITVQHFIIIEEGKCPNCKCIALVQHR